MDTVDGWRVGTRAPGRYKAVLQMCLEDFLESGADNCCAKKKSQPGQVPNDSAKERYCGPITLIIGVCCFPCICFCPLDERPAGTMMPAVQAQPYYPPHGQPVYLPPQGQQGYPQPGYPPQKDPGMPAAF